MIPNMNVVKKINRNNLFAFLVVAGFFSLLTFHSQNLSSFRTAKVFPTTTERDKGSLQSYNPVQCHKCLANSSESDTLDPRNWIPKELPFVYFRAFGGLGNQLFEYACVHTIAMKHKMPLLVYVDSKPGSELPGFKLNPGDFALHLLNVPLPRYDQSLIQYIDDYMENAENKSRVMGLGDGAILSQNYQTTSKILKLNDYCQSELFFHPYRDEIRRFFKPKTVTPAMNKWKSLMTRVDEIYDSVCVHVRRGDFTYTPDRLVNASFYLMAMNEMRHRLETIGRSPVFFIFSDNIESVKTDFSKMLPTKAFDQLQWVSDSEKTLVEDLYLLAQCKHNILSGSSFGWWGAYLNEFPNKIIIASHFKSELFKDDPFHSFHYRHVYYPMEWIVRESEYAN